MFERKKTKESMKVKEIENLDLTTKTEEELKAERIIARAERVRCLGEEAGMWRAFATGCKPGRWLYESQAPFYGLERPPSLSLHMDADTAQLWQEFALRMAADRESRLRDVLSSE